MRVDYHMHLRGPPVEGVEPLELTVEAVTRFAEEAARRGVDEIGFTEHVYYFRQTREIWVLPYHLERCGHDLDTYCDAVLEAKRQGLPVKLGLEVDFVRDRQGQLAELLEPYPFDFLLGSVHEVADGAVDQRPGIWERGDVEEIWRRYFSSLRELAESKHVDVLAHPDLPKIYGRRPSDEVVAELHGEAAEAIGRSGVAVEISTAGLRKPVGKLYPDESFLAECRRHGAVITTASDAHEPGLVAQDLGQAVELARRVGYETVSVFDGRARRQESLS
jgi:histidinol-phosphatase (PHP family)